MHNSIASLNLLSVLKKEIDFPAELSTDHKAAIDKLKKEVLCSAPTSLCM
jgi:hypothetical protein